MPIPTLYKSKATSSYAIANSSFGFVFKCTGCTTVCDGFSSDMLDYCDLLVESCQFSRKKSRTYFEMGFEELYLCDKKTKLFNHIIQEREKKEFAQTFKNE